MYTCVTYRYADGKASYHEFANTFLDGVNCVNCAIKFLQILDYLREMES